MNERDVQLESRKVFFIMLLFSCIIAWFLKTVSYPVGIVIGYIICSINFILTIHFSDLILKSGQNVMMVIIMYIAKMILMILGFALAVIWKDTIHILTVFLGYMITPITIHWLNYKWRKEE